MRVDYKIAPKRTRIITFILASVLVTGCIMCLVFPTYPFLASLWLGNKPIQTFFLKLGASPRTFPDGCGTPILCRIPSTFPDASFEFLIDHGAELNRADKIGTPPLHYLLGVCHFLGEEPSTGRSRTVKLFLTRGARIDSIEPDGSTPLHRSMHGLASSETIRLLIQNGANPLQLDSLGRTPFQMAFDPLYGSDVQKNQVICVFAECGTDLLWKDREGFSCLHWAIMRDIFPTTIERLVQSGANVNAKTPENLTPLHLASSRGFRDIVRILIANGADVNSRTNRGETPLDLALQAKEKSRKESKSYLRAMKFYIDDTIDAIVRSGGVASKPSGEE